MYLHLSLRKIGTLALLSIVLGISVSLTFALKEARYGSTPPFASLGLAFQEITSRAWYVFEGSAWKASQAASLALAFSKGEEVGMKSAERALAVPVLTYHRIVGNPRDSNNVTEANFKDQMLTLKRAGWETITLKEYMEFIEGKRELPERSFLITFDDGAKESFYPVDPLFEALGYEGVIYIIASAAHTRESTYYLSPNEIERLLGTSRWEIGSHSYDGHRPYAADGAGSEGIFFADKLWREEDGRLETKEEFTQRVRDDLKHARAALEAEYGVTVDSFAFPLGNETGVEGAANFPEGAAITAREASKIYSLGFLQTNDQGHTFNYLLDHAFIARRIHVDHDWSGERLLQELEKGLPKAVPFQDDFSEPRGWISAWGALDLGRNNLSLRADKTASSASTFLDGSRLWNNYSFNVSLNWREGSVFLLADVTDSKTYDSCAFSPGIVRIQSTVDGTTRLVGEVRDERIAPGTNVHLGIRVHDAVIECLWEYESVVESYERNKASVGGIGLQAWNPELGHAALQVSEILVRPFDG